MAPFCGSVPKPTSNVLTTSSRIVSMRVTVPPTSAATYSLSCDAGDACPCGCIPTFRSLMCLKVFKSTTASVSVFSSEMYSFSCVVAGAGAVCASKDTAAKHARAGASAKNRRFMCASLRDLQTLRDLIYGSPFRDGDSTVASAGTEIEPEPDEDHSENGAQRGHHLQRSARAVLIHARAHDWQHDGD